MDKNLKIQAVVLFAALTLAGVCLVVLGQSAGESMVRATLPPLGAGLFSAGLTYFLITASQWERGK